MRFMMHVSFPVEKFNQAVLDGTIRDKMRRILEDAKPEAVYFCTDDGKRGGFLVIDMTDAAQMPKFAEPWFLLFDATVKFLPAMTPEDLARGGLDQIAARWK